MKQDRDKLKLSAILSADVVGYSRLMEEDQAWTIKNLEENKTLIRDLVEDYKGRVVDAPGDNILAEFNSITNAVECAVKIQQELKKKNSKLIEKHRMEYRIGINLGEVFEEGGRIYGSGVNIAARIEGLSKSGGICISGRTYDHIKSKFEFGYEYLGKHNVKNISEPIRVYHLLTESTSGTVIHKKRSGKLTSGEKKVPTLSEKPSIVVLPFVNMSNDPEQEYFSDGMTEELINALAKLEGLKVISRTSAFYFKGEHTDLRTIGQKLSVENVLEGSVRKAGNKLRITAQLIKVEDDTHLWSEAYNRELDDVFAIQDEISRAIVDSLKIRLFGKEKANLVKIYTNNIEAYEAYIKGYYFLKTFMGNNEKTLQYFKKAIALDPCYAQAYSAIAEYYVSITMIGQKFSRDEVYTKAREAINTALEIDNGLAEAHATLGLIKMLFEWDWKGAEKAFEKAINLNPGLSKSHYDYAYYLSLVGDFERSILEARKAVELDPLHGIAHFILGFSLFTSGQYDQAVKEILHAREMIPGYQLSYTIVAMIYIMKNMFEKAMDETEKGLELFPRNPRMLSFKSFIHAKKGEKEKARAILDELHEMSKKEYVSPFSFALIYSALGEGEVEKVLKYLEECYEKRDISLVHSLFMLFSRNDPRLNAFLKRIGL